MSTEEALAAVRPKLAIALDVDDLILARRLAASVSDYFGVVKIGLELFSAAGPEAIGVMHDLGMDVFLDVKLHDIPNTVGKAGRVLGALGAKYLTMHARGGEDMLKAGVEGLNAGADAAGLDAPIGLAVTVLTSDSGAPAHIVPRRLRMAMESGCGGIVCAAEDLSDARTIAPRLVRVVPGIRPAGVPTDDQARSATPQEAFDGGADLLVIGRAVTNADDPEEAAAKLALSLT
ncbi:MAG: orotidine-5'-phosphate decarboxylase [Acidimicrobiales bacterium]|jgi:orotidine-5'-phosphate decarboxylase